MRKKVRFSNKVMIKYFKKSEPIYKTNNLKRDSRNTFSITRMIKKWRYSVMFLFIIIFYKFFKRIS